MTKKNSKANASSRKRSLLSCSGASRWLNCPVSAKLELNFPRSSSTYANEGNLAHTYAETILQFSQKIITKKAFEKKVEEIEANPLHSSEMRREVEKYTNYVLERFAMALSKDSNAVLKIENHVTLAEVMGNGVDQNNGYIDAIIIGGDMIEIIDLKYGLGVMVKAEENPQLMLYGYAALELYDLSYNLKTIRLTVSQVRKNSLSYWDISADKLKEWIEVTVAPQVVLAHAGEGDHKAGEWCRFCRAKPKCSKYSEMMYEVAKDDFRDPKIIDDKTLIDLYLKKDLIVSYIKSIEKYMYEQVTQKGVKYDGLKLIESSGRRSWGNESEAVKTLFGLGFKEEEITTTKIKGIGEISNLMTVDKFEKKLSKFLIKPSGAPKLVKLSHKSPAIGLAQAKADFAEAYNEEEESLDDFL